MKHTKGPWVTEDETSINEHGAVGIDISNLHGSTENLATVWCFDTDDEEGNANARLIAAAPELLEVLIEIKNNTDIWDNLFLFQKERINDVINKATNHDI
jgi:hypothetical protein